MTGVGRYGLVSALAGAIVTGPSVHLPGRAAGSERWSPSAPNTKAEPFRLPPGAHATVSGAIGRDAHAFHARPTPDGYRLENARHDLAMDLSADGVRVSSPAQEWHLRYRGLGRGDVTAPSPVVPKPVSATANRVEYRRGSLTEWYVNGPSGLEQGFTLATPPPGDRGPVRLTMDLSGNAAEDGEGGVWLGQSAGWRYRGLFAVDAAGRELKSRLELREGRLSIEVDDRDALYPLTVDPLFQIAKLTASDADQNDELGYSVAVSGDTVVVGAPFANTNAGATVDAGAAYVFVMGAAGWASMTETAKLTASDGAASDFFGFAVAMDLDTIVVGALDDDLGPGANRGSAYVFVRPAAGWVSATQTAKLTASDAADFDEFGCAVSVSTDVIVVGSRYADNGPPGNQGAAYVFVMPGGGWTTTTQTAKLSATDGMPSDLLGLSVAIDRDTIVAGAPGKDGTSANEGAAYVFEEPGGGWANMTQTAKLTALVPGGLDEMGISVALDGNTAVVGAWGADVGGLSLGAAYVFERPGGAWLNATETARLTASDGAVTGFGVSVAAGGDVVVVGSYQDDVGGSSSQGSAYLFVAPAAGWVSATESQKLVASDGAAGDEFGRAVAIAEGVAVVGSHLSSGTNAGAAYVFDIPVPTNFFTLAPCRAIDTRGPDGPLGGPALVAGADREFTLVRVCGIPDTALAVSVNMAVTGPTAVGNLRLHPGGLAVPAVSSINYGVAQTRSNNAIVRLNAEGSLAAFVGQASGTVHLILDVNGYFQP